MRDMYSSFVEGISGNVVNSCIRQFRFAAFVWLVCGGSGGYKAYLGLILLKWFNFNPKMDKQLHPL